MQGYPRHAIVVHGGAGQWQDAPRPEVLEAVQRAAALALQILTGGGTALDAAVAAVCHLEDHPLFNAGTGAALNREGEAELDAAVAVGRGLRCAGVAGLRRVQNPILVARRLLEQNDWVLLAGTGAQQFAREQGFPDHDPVTEARRAQWARLMAERGGASPQTGTGTVGAVALDHAGLIAAATSTGGTVLKAPGRVGDTPIPGAGTYATEIAGASATGLGELLLRCGTTRTACDLIAGGSTAQAAAATALARIRTVGQGPAGLITVDRLGRVGAAFNTPAMPHAWFAAADSAIQSRFS